MQLDTRLALANGMVWSPFLRAAWVHEFNPDRSIAGSFVSVPGTLFAVDGARAWSDALKFNAGSRFALNKFASLFASFDGEFANSGIPVQVRDQRRIGERGIARPEPDEAVTLLDRKGTHAGGRIDGLLRRHERAAAI